MTERKYLREVEFAAPPPDRTGSRRPDSWEERLAPVMQHPREWAMVGMYASGTASHLRSGPLRTPPGEWEFVSRVTNHSGERAVGGAVWLYARWLGSSKGLLR